MKKRAAARKKALATGIDNRQKWALLLSGIFIGAFLANVALIFVKTNYQFALGSGDAEQFIARAAIFFVLAYFPFRYGFQNRIRKVRR